MSYCHEKGMFCEFAFTNGYCSQAVCRKPYTVTYEIRTMTPATNADRIRAVSDEELAKRLAFMWDCCYCSEHERLGDNPLLSDEQCDLKCVRHCLEWLKKPYKEEV